MTATLHRTFTDPTTATASGDSLLRFALRADATVCAGVGLLVAMAADRLARIAVLAGNVAFAVVTVIAIGVGWLALTGTGDDLVLGFVSATAVLAWLQYRGVRRLA